MTITWDEARDMAHRQTEIRETLATINRRDAPLRRMVAFVGGFHSGPKRGERLRFRLECGHEVDRIPYQMFWHAAGALRDGGTTDKRTRCEHCAIGERHEH